ncbi:SAM-dependent methyltransferase [Amycolatopsis sp. MtRt-6]|uniref:SAM-dependent methyltransferase n=1 Tax=Amycolatopsis sp. MtRt-6 TaxID=2792782 RepID=UPI001A8E9C5C|nr:SAM-dependent methyltransferase [Amycolatopsis sp. MtRt-6]
MSRTADGTALGPMVIVAVDQFEPAPLIHDPLAAELLPASGKFAVALTRWPPLRRAMVSATEKKVPGLWAGILCRKRYLDDQLLEAAAGGLDAVVVLGAGFDTRAYRLPPLRGIPVYEVDLPANVTRKEAALRKHFGRVPVGVTLVPVDFETQQLRAELARHGFTGGRKTFVVWEAVTQYLTEPAVRHTLAQLTDLGPGSRLAFTYVRKDFLDGEEFYGARAAHDDFVTKWRLWRFGLRPGDVAGLLAEYGWREREQLGPAEFTSRYLRPAGRDLPVSEIERSVLAELTG